MWKGGYVGQAVAVEVLRKFLNSDSQMIVKVGAGRVLFPCVDALTKPRTEVLQGGRDVENPSTSKCVTVGRGDNDRDPVRNGTKMDNE